MKNSKVNGFAVIEHRGREITEAQAFALADEDKKHVRRKTNGPHHEAKWAQHLQLKVVSPVVCKNVFGVVTLVKC